MRHASWFAVAALGSVLLASAPVRAGDLKVGAQALETDDDGKLTKAAASAAVTELEAEPGDEAWVLHLWGKVDKPAVGPLYVELYRDRDGKMLVAHRHEIADYEGDPYLSLELEIGRDEGFRPGDKIEIAFVQNVGGKDVKKSKGKLTLAKSSAPPPRDEPEPEPEDEEAPEDDPAEADTPAPTPDAPPPVAPAADKGCTIGAPASTLPDRKSVV